MSHRIVVHLDAAADVCFEAFCNIDLLPKWVPGLRSAGLVSTHPQGRPAEVRFESQGRLNGTVEYSLIYAYDERRMRVAWSPGDGAPNAVRGFAAFDAEPDGCKMTYVLKVGSGEEGRETMAHAEKSVEAFRRFIARGR